MNRLGLGLLALFAVCYFAASSAAVKCPKIACKRKCKFGYQKNKLGCETCACNPDPCKNACAKDEYCTLERVMCVKQPCPPIPTCRPICKLPREVGPCKGSFPRFYFDSNTMKCTKFVYGGCGGNQNNYHTLKACQRMCPQAYKCPPFTCSLYCKFGNQEDENGCKMCACKPSPCDNACAKDEYCTLEKVECVKEPCPPLPTCHPICKLPREVGPCRGSFPRFYFDSNTMKCTKFVYGGCGGNQNNYHTLEECQRMCPQAYKCPPFTCSLYCKFGNKEDENGCKMCACNPSPCDQVDCEDNEYCTLKEVMCFRPPCPKIPQCKSVCTLPKQPGTCKGYMPRYYFDEASNSCKKFIYGGCFGNQNNFKVLEDCQDACKDRCPKLICALYHCEFGYQFDSDDCRTCKCNMHPCAARMCGPGFVCEAKPCYGYRCTSEAKCVPV